MFMSNEGYSPCNQHVFRIFPVTNTHINKYYGIFSVKYLKRTLLRPLTVKAVLSVTYANTAPFPTPADNLTSLERRVTPGGGGVRAFD